MVTRFSGFADLAIEARERLVFIQQDPGTHQREIWFAPEMADSIIAAIQQAKEEALSQEAAE